jgi:hypothetical protein
MAALQEAVLQVLLAAAAVRLAVCLAAVMLLAKGLQS